MSSDLKSSITDDMKAAMRAGEKQRLGTIRLVLAAIKQVEVDTREDLNDDQVMEILARMIKQRRESIRQYEEAGRDELAAVEKAEIDIIQHYLPEQLADDELEKIVRAAVEESGAESLRDMGKVMGLVKSRVAGRADMGKVSDLVKQTLGS